MARPKHCTFMASNSFLISAVYFLPLSPQKFLVLIWLTLEKWKPGGLWSHLVVWKDYMWSVQNITSPKSLSLHCKEIKSVKSKVDGQLSSLLTCRQVFDYEAAFTLMHFVFLELGTHCLLDFKLLTAKNKLITAKTVHLQLLNNDYMQ